MLMNAGVAIIPNVKIAVVDDDSSIRKLIVTALMYCVNRDVLSFDGGTAAWDYIKNADGIDIVLTDVEMPDMDGFELVSRVKRHYPDTICVVISGNASNEKAAQDLGADAFLAKPFKINDLFDIVQTYVVGDAPY